MRIKNVLIAGAALVAVAVLCAAGTASLPEADAKASPGEPVSQSGRAGEYIDWQVLSDGGTETGSTNYTMTGTVNQTAVGTANSTTYAMGHGYHEEPPSAGGCCTMRGDVNDDNAPIIDIADLVYLVDYMFTGGPPPPCWDEGDIDASGVEPIDIGDLVWLVDYMFTGGAEPPPC